MDSSTKASRLLVKNQAVLLCFNLGCIDAGDLFQVVDGFERSVLSAVFNYCRGFRSPESRPAFEIYGASLVDVDPRDFLSRKVGREVVDDCTGFPVSRLG